MIHLLVPFYVDARKVRSDEIEASVRKNLANSQLGSVTLFCEKHEASVANTLMLLPKTSGHARRVVTPPHRAVYADLLNFITRSEDVVVVANADIYFDATIALAEHVVHRQVLCLTRAEERPFDEGLYWPQSETGLCHDVWIFRPPLNIPGQFEFGKPGCDLRFAGECEKAGYALFNPCRQIHAIHNHTSGLRNYVLYGPVQVGSPYAHVYVTPEWPLRPVEAKTPQPAPVDQTSRNHFVRECMKSQLSGLWSNCNVDSMMTTADKRVAAMFDMAEKAAREAERRGLLP